MNNYDDITNTEIFANQLLINGLDRNKKILEISQSKEGYDSLTAILNKWKPKTSYLLSSELNSKEIYGECGRLVTIPEVDFNKKSKKSIDSFDTIISEGYNSDAILLGALPQEIYAGYCVSFNDPRIKELKELYMALYSYLKMNAIKNNQYCCLVEEEYKLNEKELCLIIKK